MAAAATVAQLPLARKSPINSSGVLTLSGFGVRVSVKNGHLEIEDGVGMERRRFRLPRVAHGLKRLVVIANDGFVSFGALRWLTDQDAAFVMLERDGTVVTTTGPVRSADVKLRRAQALAHHSGAALRITRELIHRKLAGQEQVAREELKNADVAATISDFRLQMAETDSIDAVRLIESRAAKAYWSAWRSVAVNFPKQALARVPEHWRMFGTRISPITSSPRVAVNPANAMLNYLYAILQTEAHLAAAALGLDPGLGVLHVDATSRDSLSCDLMEPVRPQVDLYVLRWIQSHTLLRDWFFEQRDGNCRMKREFTERLSDTAVTWQRAVAPFAEFAAQSFWTAATIAGRDRSLPTHLTQTRRRESRGIGATVATSERQPEAPRLCKSCGKALKKRTSHCADCGRATARENMILIAHKGRVASHTDDAHARLSATQRRQAAARLAWNPKDKPAWLDRETYLSKVQPRLNDFTVSAIAMAIGTSLPYAHQLRKGIRVPHPMHWKILADLVSFTG